MNKKKVEVKSLEFEIFSLSSPIDSLSSPIDEMTFHPDFETNVIFVKYKPTGQETETESLDKIEDCKLELMFEMKNIINSHKEIYREFDIEYYFNRTTIQMYRDNGRIFVISIELRLDIKWKGVAKS